MPDYNGIAEPFLDQNTPSNLKAELERFHQTLSMALHRLPSVSLAPDTICVSAEGDQALLSANPHSQINMSILGVVHGNEIAGLPVLTTLLQKILDGSIRVTKPVALGLGNAPAALAGMRFLDRDLNRSFGNASLGASREGSRARELQGLLCRTRYLLDVHQTREPSETAFFIFPFARKSFDFARMISPGLPVVTHWSGSFSQDGMCTDEYVNSKGGTGITIELGQAGFEPAQIATGVASALHALHVTGSASVRELPAIDVKPGFKGAVYTWAGTIPYPKDGEVRLVPDLKNFQQVRAGDVIGSWGDTAITCPFNGRILFPKYIRPGTPDASAPRPAELCRVIRTVTEQELPA